MEGLEEQSKKTTASLSNVEKSVEGSNKKIESLSSNHQQLQSRVNTDADSMTKQVSELQRKQASVIKELQEQQANTSKAEGVQRQKNAAHEQEMERLKLQQIAMGKDVEVNKRNIQSTGEQLNLLKTSVETNKTNMTEQLKKHGQSAQTKFSEQEKMIQESKAITNQTAGKLQEFSSSINAVEERSTARINDLDKKIYKDVNILKEKVQSLDESSKALSSDLQSTKERLDENIQDMQEEERTREGLMRRVRNLEREAEDEKMNRSIPMLGSILSGQLKNPTQSINQSTKPTSNQSSSQISKLTVNPSSNQTTSQTTNSQKVIQPTLTLKAFSKDASNALNAF